MRVNMKKSVIFLSILIVGAMSLASCNKIAGLLSYNLALQTIDGQFTVPIITDTTQSQNAGTTTVYINVDSFIRASTGNNLGVNNISSVKVQSCSITAQNADSHNNFANFQSCDFSFSSDVNSSVIHPATITNNQDTYAASINLPVDNNLELKSYLTGHQFSYFIKAKMRRPTTKQINCTVHVQMNITVQ